MAKYRNYNEGETNWDDEIQKDVSRQVFLLVPPFFRFRTFLLLLDVFIKNNHYEGCLVQMVSNQMSVQSNYNPDDRVSLVAVSYNDTVT